MKVFIKRQLIRFVRIVIEQKSTLDNYLLYNVFDNKTKKLAQIIMFHCNINYQYVRDRLAWRELSRKSKRIKFLVRNLIIERKTD